MASYTLTDHFRDNGNGEQYFAENRNLPGMQIKGGAKYEINDNVSAFVNLGWVKATPTFDKAINDASGKVYKQSFADNETFNSYEGGLNWSAPNGKLALSASYYYTLWLNRTNSFFVYLTDGTEDAVYLTGMNAKHSGLEFEAALKPISGLRIDLSASFGDWTMMDDVSGEYTDYSSGAPVTTQVNYYLKGLHVGDAPQNQQAVVVSYTGVKNLNATLTYRNYSKYYADWNVFGRTNEADRAESWQVPNFQRVGLELELPFAHRLQWCDHGRLCARVQLDRCRVHPRCYGQLSLQRVRRQDPLCRRCRSVLGLAPQLERWCSHQLLNV